jgi:hypothetical protein
MAEDHRRVEARSIVGTGMATDPERITAVADERARRERAWRDPPAVAFGAVLEHAPAKGTFDDAVEPDPRRPPPPEPETSTTTAPSTSPPAPASSSSKPASKPMSSRPRPSLPDPRERMLRAQLARSEGRATPSPLSSTETPPTGKSVRPRADRPLDPQDKKP